MERVIGTFAWPKAQDAAGWARGHLGTIDHEQRVARIADTLFRLTEPWHRLGEDDRAILHVGALVHDVGRSVDKTNHALIGATMVLGDERLAMGEADRRRAAFLTRYHRGRVPDRGEELVLRGTDDRRSLRRLLGLLRAADALDSRQLESPRLVFALRQRTVEVLCYLEEDSPEARATFRHRKKFRLLEEELDCTIEVELRCSQNLEMVA